jgi:hypothetical protein
VIVDHHLSNKGLWPVETAPWVLTMLKPGGIAILPQNSEPADKAGLLPNRNLVLWRYTDMESPYISWGNRYIFVNASLERGSLKLGFPNPRRWLAYFWNGTLFVKYAAYNPERAYFDMGSSSQCYCGPDFIELETLGPRTLIPPGGSITHREVWRVFGDVTFSPEEIAAEQLVHDLDLESGAAYSLL